MTGFLDGMNGGRASSKKKRRIRKSVRQMSKVRVLSSVILGDGKGLKGQGNNKAVSNWGRILVEMGVETRLGSKGPLVFL